MRYTRYLSLIALVLLVTLAAVSTARADEDQSAYSVQARVARISLLSGDVQVRRAGSREWESAAVNLPLVEGDELATGRNSHLEVQIDAYNFVRLSDESLLSIVTLRDEGVALSLSTGTATLRLARFDREHEYFEIDAPKITMAAEKTGYYRLDAERSGDSNDVHITVRDGGRARIYNETSGFTLREGRTARLVFNSGSNDGGDWELASAPQPDGWDEWVDQREYNLAQQLRYERRDREYDSSLWGAEELDAYGDWVDAGEYGRIWRPRATVINNYYNWAPYRYGYWDWCPPYGWVWVGQEPWGWAPYHYGRWVYYNNYWCWSPHSYYYGGRHRSWWHPALVVFVSFNNSVCWYPVPHHNPDPVYAGPVKTPNDHPAGPGGPVLPPSKMVNTRTLTPPLGGGYQTAVTTMPVTDFGMISPKIKSAPLSVAQTVIQSEPVAATNLPIGSPKGGIKSDGPVKSENPLAVSPTRGRDKAASAPLETGAARRKPGVALDDELRKTRVLNGREPILTKGPDRGGLSGETKDTGAVTRPVRPPAKTTSTGQGSDSDTIAPVRPTRSTPSVKSDNSSDTMNEPVRPPRKPERPQVSEPPVKSEPLPDRPRRSEPKREQSEPIRTAPPPRYEPPPQKSEPPPAPPPQKSNEAPLNRSKGKGDGR